MFSIKNKKTLALLETWIWSFVWILLAMAWTSFFDSILNALERKFLFLWIIWKLIYAIIVTIFVIFLINIYIHTLDKLNENKDK